MSQSHHAHSSSTAHRPSPRLRPLGDRQEQSHSLPPPHTRMHPPPRRTPRRLPPRLPGPAHPPPQKTENSPTNSPSGSSSSSTSSSGPSTSASASNAFLVFLYHPPRSPPSPPNSLPPSSTHNLLPHTPNPHPRPIIFPPPFSCFPRHNRPSYPSSAKDPAKGFPFAVFLHRALLRTHRLQLEDRHDL